MNAGGSGGLNPFEASVDDIIQMKMKTGRKRFAVGDSAFDKEGIKRLKSKLAEEKNVHTSTPDPRTNFISRRNTAADRLKAFLLHKAGVQSFATASFDKQKEIAEHLRTTNAIPVFDPARSENEGASRHNIYEYSIDATMQELENFSTCTPEMLEEIRRVVEVEVSEEKEREDVVQKELAVGKCTVQELKTALRARSLDTKGNKPDLLERVREHNVSLNLGDEEEESEEHRKAVAAWSKLRRRQLIGRLERAGMETVGNKQALAKRVSLLFHSKAPKDVYVEYKIPFFTTLRERLLAMRRLKTAPEVKCFVSALWNLSVFVIRTLKVTIYGGLVRDLVIRGYYHLGMDIDASIPDDLDAEEAGDKLREWTEGNNCTFKKFVAGHRSGNHVLTNS
jgi:hypothetical protein